MTFADGHRLVGVARMSEARSGSGPAALMGCPGFRAGALYPGYAARPRIMTCDGSMAPRIEAGACAHGTKMTRFAFEAVKPKSASVTVRSKLGDGFVRRSPHVAHASGADVGLGAAPELAVELAHHGPAAGEAQLGARGHHCEIGGRLGAADDEACDRGEAEEGCVRLRRVLPVVRPGGAAEHVHQRAPRD